MKFKWWLIGPPPARSASTVREGIPISGRKAVLAPVFSIST